MTGLLAAALAALWVIVIAQGLALVVLMREIGRIYLRLGPAPGARVTGDGPEVGEMLLQVEAHDQRGVHWTIGGTRAQPLLLLFMTETCPACEQLARPLLTFAGLHHELTILLVFDRLSLDANELLKQRGLHSLAAIVDSRLPNVYAVRRFPYALLVDGQGNLLSKGIVNTLDHLESLCWPLVARDAGQAELTREVEVARTR